jgi:predicted nucleotidyltransferase
MSGCVTDVTGVLGFREALSATLIVLLPRGIEAPVVSGAGLALLKLVVWVDQRDMQPPQGCS